MASASTRPSVSVDVALSDMATIALTALNEIAVVARLALDHMETPQGSGSASELIAGAMEAILVRAEIVHNDIDCLAEDAGCPFEPRRQARRSAAGAAGAPAIGGP